MASANLNPQREVRSFLMARDPSIDRRFRPRPQKRERLFAEIEEDDYSSDSSVSDTDIDSDIRSSGITDANSSDGSHIESGALVYLRLRPVSPCPSPAYKISEDGNVLITGPPLECASTSNNKNSMEKHYSFSGIFNAAVSQSEVYEKCIGQKIEMEESLSVMTYGTSGSGKTFTLLGDANRPGVIPRSLEHIFTQYQTNIYPNPVLKLVNGRITVLDDSAAAKENSMRCKIMSSCPELEGDYANLQQRIAADHNFPQLQLDDGVSVLIWVSFVEIYNELVYDLLAPMPTGGNNKMQKVPARKNLKIVCNDGNVFIKGLTSVFVKTSAEALRLLRWGLQKLTYASTSINANSSRSHCIFFVDVLKYYRSGVITETSFKFCDLAGSERLDKTGNMGSRLKEAQRINTSLMVLGRCLDAANSVSAGGKDRIPFRESKLTMLLQAALLGKEKMAMIVNVTPTDKYYEENLNVLSFAAIAKNILFKAPVTKQNKSRYSVFEGKELDNNEYVQQLLEENAFLRNDNEDLLDENARLRDEIERLTNERTDELQKQEQELRIQLVDSFQITLEENKKNFERRLQTELESQKRIFESKMEFLKRKYEDELEDLREEVEELEKENKENIEKLELKETHAKIEGNENMQNQMLSKKRRTIE
ncbi:kinesin-like protein subito [Musca domestica]|uniref:Kinesin-like protein subito n=1 Tax=Musca domestica TaxID=7370 RepID=A0A9J7CXZ6_MUSDO|nr:kinesin-like protein subito [Musca domestica]